MNARLMKLIKKRRQPRIRWQADEIGKQIEKVDGQKQTVLESWTDEIDTDR